MARKIEKIQEGRKRMEKCLVESFPPKLTLRRGGRINFLNERSFI